MLIDSIIKNARGAMAEDQIKKSCEQFCNFVGFEKYMVFGSVFHTMVDPPSININNIGSSANIKRNTYQAIIEDAFEHSRPIIYANNLPQGSPLLQSAKRGRRGAYKNEIGICFPVHFPSGRFAMLYLKTRSDSKDYSDLIMSVVVAGNQFAREIGTAVLRVLEYNLGSDSPYLSVREKECLLLASDGLTPLEISKKLELSTHTVLFHLKKARKKLASKNLQGAIRVAIMNGDVTARIQSGKC